MACVTSEEVLAIMNGCPLTTSEQIDPFILSAHAFITRVLAEDTTVTAAQKVELEKWLAAHLIASIYGSNGSGGAGGTVKREKVGEAEIEYAVPKVGTGLDGTIYGQMVKQLDPTGLLALAGKKAASIYAVKQFEE